MIEKVRAMLNEFNLPTFSWGEAMKTAAYLRNVMPEKGHHISPYELMYGVKPSADHLHVFGCAAHVHIPKQLQVHKTDPTGRLGMFIGYAENSEAYRILSWDTGKLLVIESACCTFAEHTSPTIDLSTCQAIAQQVQTEVFDDDDDDWWYENLVNLPVHNKGETAEEEGFTEADLVNAGEDTDDEEGEEADALDSDAAVDEHNQRPGQGRWPGRVRNAPDRLVYNVQGGKVKHVFDNPTVKQALLREDAALWVEAINKELASIFQKDVYDEVDPPEGKRILTTMLVLHIKRSQWGGIIKYKARLVVRGNMQVADVDNADIYAPTAQPATFRVRTALAAQRKLVMHQIDVSTAF
jgi:hypothetical protein